MRQYCYRLSCSWNSTAFDDSNLYPRSYLDCHTVFLFMFPSRSYRIRLLDEVVLVPWFTSSHRLDWGVHVMYSVFIEWWGNIRTRKAALNIKAFLLPMSPSYMRLQLADHERLSRGNMKQQLDRCDIIRQDTTVLSTKR